MRIGGQRVPQLVAEHGEELVLAPVGLLDRLLGPPPLGDLRLQHGVGVDQFRRPLLDPPLQLGVRPACLLLGQSQRLLGLPPCRQVTGDLEEPSGAARLVPQGGDDDVGPEPGAVLAHPPALVLEPPVGHGPPQLLLGPARPDGLLGVEAGEVLADDLVGPVALDPLGPGVPGGDVPGRVEQEDGVVAHPLDQLVEVLLGPTLRLFGPHRPLLQRAVTCGNRSGYPGGDPWDRPG